MTPDSTVGETAARGRPQKGTFPVYDTILAAWCRPSRRHVGGATIAILCIVLAAAGCSKTRQPKLPLTPAAPDPVGEARSLLESYGGGQLLGSESINYEDLVKRVTAVDAAKGEKLKAFTTEALQKGRVDAAKAKKLAAEL